MGLEGFTGNESILYHLESPCRVKELGDFTPIEREEWVPEAHAHRRMNTYDVDHDRRRDQRPPDADVEQRRRDLALPAGLLDGLLLPERRGGRGDLRPRGLGNARDDVRRRRVQGRGLHRRPARHDLPVRAERRAALSRLRDARAHRDPAPLSKPVRPDPRRRAVLPPRHPSAGRAEDAPGSRRLPRQGARPRRLPGLRPRLPPVRRRRLGRLPLPVDVLHPRLRADHGPDPPAAALAPDVPGAELRHLLVLPAPPRLRSRGGTDPVPPQQSSVGGDDLLRLRELRLAQGHLGGLDHAASVRAPARAGAGPGRESTGRSRDHRARGHVRHVPAAQALAARPRPGRRPLRPVLVRASVRGAGPGGVTSHL